MRRSLRIVLWVVAIGVALAVIVGAIASIMVLRNTTITRPTEKEAMQEFERVLARFSGRPTLVHITNPLNLEIEINRAPATDPLRRVETFRVLAWSGREQKLVRTSAPVWMMRFSLENLAAEIGLPIGRWPLTVEDVQRYGPGIITDFKPPGGGRVLVWVE